MRMTSYGYLKPGTLIPGKVNKGYFRHLVEICSVCNPKMTGALEEVLVFGKTRKEACALYGVTTSYFSIKIRQLQSVSILIHEMFPCAQGLNACPLHVKNDK